MKRNDEIQAAIISKLKGNTTVTALLLDSNEIREDQWQGTEFSYPNIRVQLTDNSPLNQDAECSHAKISLSILVFSESSNSLEADRIAGIINNELHSKQFTTNGIAISLRTTNLVPAIRSGIRVWRAQILMSGIASG